MRTKKKKVNHTERHTSKEPVVGACYTNTKILLFQQDNDRYAHENEA